MFHKRRMFLLVEPLVFQLNLIKSNSQQKNRRAIVKLEHLIEICKHFEPFNDTVSNQTFSKCLLARILISVFDPANKNISHTKNWISCEMKRRLFRLMNILLSCSTENFHIRNSILHFDTDIFISNGNEWIESDTFSSKIFFQNEQLLPEYILRNFTFLFIEMSHVCLRRLYHRKTIKLICYLSLIVYLSHVTTSCKKHLMRSNYYSIKSFASRCISIHRMLSFSEQHTQKACVRLLSD